MQADKGDLTLKTDEGFFNHRVVCFCFQDGKILLEKNPKGFWFPLGGRIKFGETSIGAAKREIAEELHIENVSCELAGYIENFFKENGQPCHEVSPCFRIELPQGFTAPKTTTEGKGINLEWVHLNDIPNLNLYPQFLRTELQHFMQGFKHTMFNQNEQTKACEA